MEHIDARRLTGPNLLQNGPGSILDVRCSVEEARKLIPFWESKISRMLKDLGWERESTSHHYLSTGLSLALSAPIDALYAATEINEWAWACCAAEFMHGEPPDDQEHLKKIRQEIRKEARPSLRKLQSAARTNAKTFLWDDDNASVGLGNGSRTWPAHDLPDPAEINWAVIHDIPVGIVTGTNGKTTTVRLAKHIARQAMKNVGLSSTDAISVNERIVDEGDWSGPGGARLVLRQPGIDLAILETARGGLLRRGLGVDRADAALITNVAEDHLGDFGSQTLKELLNVKWIVSRAVEKEGALILNADDELLLRKSRTYPGEIVWFGFDPRNPTVRNHIKNGGTAFLRNSDNELIMIAGETSETICESSDIPITLNGTASHNIANALAAAALAHCLKIPTQAIRSGLTTMSQDDNPGRSNLYSIEDFKVLVDFAHNPNAMRALFSMAAAIPAKRRLLAFGQAGDRTDEQIRELTKAAWDSGLDHVIVSELEAYRRGRQQGEVFEIIEDELRKNGARKNQIQYFDEETDSLTAALNWAKPKDLIIMLALSDRAAIQEKLKAISN